LSFAGDDLFSDSRRDRIAPASFQTSVPVGPGYSFPVVLVTLRRSHVTRKASEIALAETGKNDWVVG
jgi:hypothetical protein